MNSSTSFETLHLLAVAAAPFPSSHPCYLNTGDTDGPSGHQHECGRSLPGVLCRPPGPAAPFPRAPSLPRPSHILEPTLPEGLDPVRPALISASLPISGLFQMPGWLFAHVTPLLLRQASQRRGSQEPLLPGTRDSLLQEQDWFRQEI